MSRQPREWTPGQLKRMRGAVESGDLTMTAVAVRFRCSTEEVGRLIAAHGWRNPYAGRVKPKPGVLKPPKPAPFNAASYDRDVREEDERRQRALYGDLFDDVQFLRRVGFGVHREGAGYRVGNQMRTAAEVRGIAARERRLRQPAVAATSTAGKKRGRA